ncbi:MAG: UDP-glucose 4-epimerase GalE, partial [Microbacteriaceae bacterium]|nr:UDP-glucose 4-epimerase GalE [Microbacteriaceae bacterium]
YVHVADVAAAHVAAALALGRGDALLPVYNLGTGTGTSVREIMRALAEATGSAFTPEIGPRRAGDPARIVASSAAAERDLRWRAERDLADMARSAAATHPSRRP